MPIISHFPKRQIYASEKTRGFMAKEDVLFLKSLQDKLDSVGNIIGVKIHSFATLNDIKESTNLKNDDIVIALGNNDVLDDGYIRILKISNDSSWMGNKSVIDLNYNNLYAKLIIRIVDSSTVIKELAEILTSFDSNVADQEQNIANIIASAGIDDCEEIQNSRIDENNIIYSSMKERIDCIADFCNNRAMRRYGVRFVGTRHFGDRLYNAYGKKANPSTDSIRGVNDFDNIYPWSHMIRCNGYYSENGFIVTAYEGEPDFALDGSNGNVWVEIPKFYIKESKDFNGDIVMELCSDQIAEYRLPEKFINSDGTVNEKVYISAYNLSSYSDTPASVSGLIPDSGSYSSLLDDIQTKIGYDFCGYTADDYEIIKFLFCIEYATRNSQSVMYGATKLTRRVELSAASNVNTFSIASTSIKFITGQDCYIEDIDGNIILDNINIESVSTDGGYTYITISGDPITVLDGYILCIKPWKTGFTDTVLGPSGSPVSNISGYYPCRYRYIENPWGNQCSILYQILYKSGEIYYNKKASSLNDIISDKNKITNYKLSTSTGYIVELGFDDKYPSCRLPINTEGGNSYISYSDMFVINSSDNDTAIFVGGSIDNNVSGGLHYINITNSIDCDYKDIWVGTRLSYSK